MPLRKHHNGDKKNENSETFFSLAYFSQIGVTMAASVLIGVLLGKYLDILLGTRPWLILTFSLLGAGAAIKAVFNITKHK